MRTVGSPGRGVGADLLGALPRGRIVAVTVCAAVLAAGIAIAPPSSGGAPTVRAAGAVSTSSGSDRIIELMRQVRVIQAQLLSTQARIDTLTSERDQIALELEEALDRRSALRDDVTAARATAKTATTAAEQATATYAQAKRARKSAKRELAEAEAAVVAAQDRYESVERAANIAADAVESAERKVRSHKAGSKARRKAFTNWQMAAIQDRAAHARQALAEERATDEVVGAEAARAAFTLADYAKQEARGQRALAIAEAEAAAESLSSLETRRSRARALVRQLEAEAATVAADLKSAQKGSKALMGRLVEVQETAVEVQESLGGRRSSSGVLG